MYVVRHIDEEEAPETERNGAVAPKRDVRAEYGVVGVTVSWIKEGIREVGEIDGAMT